MKKSLLALSLTSLVLLSACEDQAAGKLLEAEKQIVQLQTDFNAAKASLAKAEEQLSELKPAYEALQKAQADFPALQVEIATLFDKSETLKFEKDPNDEFAREESSVSLFVSTPKTQVEWLDRLLQEQAFRLIAGQNAQLPQALTPAFFEEYLTQQYQTMLAQAKEDKPLGLSDGLSSYYLGQRNNIATFRMLRDSYSGGAHGMYFNTYLNIDTKTKRVITLNDLVDIKDQPQIKAVLWQNYRHSRSNGNGEYAVAVDEKDFRIADNFYFSEAGIHFIYPPYELGAYAEGEVEVLLGWYEGNFYLNNAYQRTEKDGFFDEP